MTEKAERKLALIDNVINYVPEHSDKVKLERIQMILTTEFIY